MRETVLILLICCTLMLLTYAVLKIESMTGYLGWLAIPAICLLYFTAEIAIKHRRISGGKKKRSG